MALFDGLFGDTFNTLLRCDPEEPLYLPAGMQGEGRHVPESELGYHRIYLARGFFSSALHEISHWCIAGARRRLEEDYGYWYAPDGRDAEQQRAFESVEVAPQALELLFHRAVGKPFHVSVDNLELEVDRDAFAQRVMQRAADVEQRGLPARAAAFRHALADVWQQGMPLEQAIAHARPLLPAVGEDGRLA
ncbi:elongation factor P hydroxylase [Cobetia sp. 29-18-1]|uniref:elongation factor P hydroxylase n=1 Tax=Cobetia sp. 29-18-1 TaxID=3040018 RepID=UPI00244CF9D5|nr:elongation factor P hydroxylase [Cobetia sp. 29-18-1]MDH2299254.1 elongation factor P hydroxylase [Cobetia sp. 29-18-1]